MRTILRIAILSFSIAFFASCDKDDNPAPVPESGFLESILAGNYWREEIHFVYYRGGTANPKVYIEKEGIIESYGISGGWTYEDQVILDAIYIDPDKRINRYVKEKNVYSGYYKNKYTIEYHEEDLSIRIQTPYDSLKYMGAVTGSEMQIVSIAEDQVVFDAPIKPFIWQQWQLQSKAESFGKNYIGMRIIWTKMKPLLFEWAEQLD